METPIERAAKVERSHVAADQAQREASGARFAACDGEHRTGCVETRDIEATTEEREIVIARPAPQIEEGFRLAMHVATEEAIEERHVPVVVDDPPVEGVVVGREA